MGCLVALTSLISPRLALILVWLLSDLLSRAFEGWLLPLLGFFVLPWTTLAYVAFWDWGPGTEVAGFEWFLVVLAFLVDIGAFAQGSRARAGRD